MKKETIENYLTEESLGIYLEEMFDNCNIIHNKKVEGCNLRNRPDYRIGYVIFEFDGYLHYTNPKTILKDYNCNKVWSEKYKIIRIPYFIQMKRDILNNISLGDDYLKLESQFKSGFWSDDCKLPAEFCELGIKRFINNYNYYKNHQKEIIESLEKKIENLSDILLVLPESLFEWFEGEKQKLKRT